MAFSKRACDLAFAGVVDFALVPCGVRTLHLPFRHFTLAGISGYGGDLFDVVKHKLTVGPEEKPVPDARPARPDRLVFAGQGGDLALNWGFALNQNPLHWNEVNSAEGELKQLVVFMFSSFHVRFFV